MPWETEMELLVGDEVILRRTDVSVSRFEGKSFESEGHLYVHVPYHAVILSKRKISSVLKTTGGVGHTPEGFWETVDDSLNPDFIEGQEIIVQGNISWKTTKDLKTECGIIELDGENYVVTMLNGYMLVQQDDTDFQTEFYIPGNIKNPKAETGIIAFIGKPNTAYHPQFISAGFEYGSQLTDTRFDLKVGDRVAFIKHASVDLEYDIHRTFNGQGNHYVRMQRNKILAKL